MKLAVTGKGGVGKTTVVAGLARVLADRGQRVLVIDADPASNLALALGFPQDQRLTPISEMKELIEERTESKSGSMGGFFKLNPRVDDLPDHYSLEKDGIRLMVMGTVKKGGGGCVCPENVMLRSLVAHLLLGRNEMVILDMEAGVEHLGRATARAVNKLIVVVEPGQRSLEVAQKIRHLAGDIGLNNIGLVGNKVRSEGDREFLRKKIPDLPFLGFIAYDPRVVEADLSGTPPYAGNPEFLQSMGAIADRLEEFRSGRLRRPALKRRKKVPEPKMKIAVVGAGALGGLYAGYLARSGEEVYGIDIQEKVVSAIRSFGIRMGEPGKQEVSVPLRAFRNPDEVGPVDLVMFMTKSGQTREAARSALRLFGEGTVGLTLQNGLGNPEAIESIVGEKRVLAGVTMNGSTLLGPGRILHAGRGDTIIGEMRGGLSSRVEKVAAAFNQAGLSARGSAEIWNEVWGKLLVNVGVNALTAITRLRNGLVLEHPEARGILRGAVEEAERVAKAKGIRLPYENAVQKTENGCRATAENFSSMLQDVLYQRETEVDFINGAVVREGEKLGIDTPVNRTLTALVKTIEKTYAVRA